MTSDIIATAAVPFNETVPEIAEIQGRVLFWVKEEAESRSIYMTIQQLGIEDKVYEFEWGNYEKAMLELIDRVLTYKMDINEQLLALLGGDKND